MVPRVGPQRREAGALGGADGVPEHQLFHADRQPRRRDGDGAGGVEHFAREGALHLGDAVNPDSPAGQEQDEREDQRRHALEALVPVGVLPVGRLARHAKAHQHDQRRQHIRGGVHPVGQHRARARGKAGRQHDGRERQIDADRENSQPLGAHAIFTVRQGGSSP